MVTFTPQVLGSASWTRLGPELDTTISLRNTALASLATIAAVSAVLSACLAASTNGAVRSPPTGFVWGADPPRGTLGSFEEKTKSGFRPVSIEVDWAGLHDVNKDLKSDGDGQEGRQNGTSMPNLALFGHFGGFCGPKADNNSADLMMPTDYPEEEESIEVPFDYSGGLTDYGHGFRMWLLFLSIAIVCGWLCFSLTGKLFLLGLNLGGRLLGRPRRNRRMCHHCARRRTGSPAWKPDPWSRDARGGLAGDYSDESSSGDEDMEVAVNNEADFGCKHGVMTEHGPCDHVGCATGTIWVCINCDFWRCWQGTCADGERGREGFGRAPAMMASTVNRVQSLAHVVRQLVRRLPWAMAMRIFLTATFPRGAEAVTCRTCFDQCEGCVGGAACPLLTVTANNGRLLMGAAMAAGAVGAAAATALSARDVFPLRFNKVLHRGILDRLLGLGRRPPPGTPVDVTGLTNAELADPVMTAGVELDSLLQISSRALAAGNQLEVAKLNALTTSLTTRHKIGAASRGAVELAEGTTTLVGAYLYCVVLAMRIVRSKHTDVSLVVDEARANAALKDVRRLWSKVIGEDGAKAYGLHGLRVASYNAAKRGPEDEELAVAHCGWRSTAHRRYERFGDERSQAVMGLPAAMVATRGDGTRWLHSHASLLAQARLLACGRWAHRRLAQLRWSCRRGRTAVGRDHVT